MDEVVVPDVVVRLVPMDLGDTALLAGTGALAAWGVFLAVRVPAVWRGHRSVNWSPNVEGPDVHSRSYCRSCCG